jgi:(1->4)-alpha-D-glucan 1-alpha-D-glucosylmutase
MNDGSGGANPGLERLRALAAQHGIADHYYDIWGARCEVPAAGLRQLLHCLGIAAGDEAQVEAALAATAASGLARASILPLVLVAWDGQPALELHLPELPETCTWELIEEGGTRHRGTLEGGRLALPGGLPIGYHSLALRQCVEAGGRTLGNSLLIAAPAHCEQPAAVSNGRRAWGLAVQLYGIRSARNWGVGDFTDLRRIIDQAAAAGAAMVGLNPLHALFPHDAMRASPYSPSSRRFINVVYLDVEAIAEFADCRQARERVEAKDFQLRLRQLRANHWVDYAGAWAAKLEILELLFAHFLHAHPPGSTDPRAAGFLAFRAKAGPALRRHALFEAAQESLYAADPACWGWPVWPEAWRDPDGAQVAQFARSHGERIAFYEYLQWQADEQLARASAACRERGMGIGLYQDLAVSVDRGGAEVWTQQELFALEASIGCPPDEFNLKGQDWGLVPMHPSRLRERALSPFILALRACMRHAGALRIDHVMGLARLFWVPRAGSAQAGSYVRYPFDEMLAVLALESRRNRCLIIGEDLGTVPDEVREGMQRTGILAYRVLYFSRGWHGNFLLPHEFDPDAMVTVSTHDLATLRGYWRGLDLRWREELGLYPTAETGLKQRSQRGRDLAALTDCLRRAQLLPSTAQLDEQGVVELDEAVAVSVQQYISRSASRLLCVQIEDVLDCAEQANLPGTVNEHPNWRRKLPVALEDWALDGRLARLGAALATERGPSMAAAGH